MFRARLPSRSNLDPRGLELTTLRLKLRPPQSGDGALRFPAIVESRDSLAHWRISSFRDRTVADSERFVLDEVRMFREGTEFCWFYFVRESGVFAGECALHSLDTTFSRAEVGYWCRASLWGHGYASEATLAVVDHALTHLGLARVELHCAPGNRASHRVAEKAGFAFERIARDPTHDPGTVQWVYVRTRSPLSAYSPGT